MSYPYSSDVISTDSGAVVSIRSIESFNFGITPEDKVISKLKGDYSFTIRTVSGAEYEVTALKSFERLFRSPPYFKETLSDYETGQTIAQMMYDRWLWFLKIQEQK